MKSFAAAVGFAALGVGGCATTSGVKATADAPKPEPQTATADAAAAPASPAPFASTYKPKPSAPVVIRGATVFDGLGHEFASADVVLSDGKVQGVGSNLAAPAGATEIDGRGKFVTPGVIDVHSHLGVYPSPAIQASSDGNEATKPNTAEVWAEHSVWPQDPGFSRALAGGVTTLHILPGSANLFGGRGFTIHPVLGAITVQEMKFPGAKQSLKMACGENPSRVYGSRNQSPATDMGNVAGWRQAWAKAVEYDRKWKTYEDKKKKWDADHKGDAPTAPDRDLQMDTLRGVLNGDILVEWHCYRADQMAVGLEIAKEFGFKVNAFHHAVEAYKIADLLATTDTCAAMWADWWGFKLEAYDGIRENIPFVHARHACAIVHSDDEYGIQRLNQEAAKALSDGRRAGVDIPRAEAVEWFTSNPAKALGIADQTGSLVVGKNGDVVIWNADPLSSYALAEKVFIDGALAYDRAQPTPPNSDFEIGHDFKERAQ